MKDALIWTGVILAAVVLCGLLAVEIRIWMVARLRPDWGKRAARRLFRRGLGVGLLLLVLLLLKFPSTDSLSEMQRLCKMLLCLALSLTVFGVAIWDFRIMRVEVKSEMDGFIQHSQKAFQKHIEELAADNPKFKEQLSEMVETAKKDSKKGGKPQDP